MKAIKTFVSGLLLSAVFLLPTTLRAAELQPFFTAKVSSINALIGVVEKISTMADFANDPSFREAVATVRSIKGFNLNGNFGFAGIDDDGIINMMFVLPITDLWGAEIPDSPEIFDSLRPFLTRRGPDRTDINLPFGTLVALQKQGYLVVVSEDIADRIPADVRTFFADLEKYTFGIKLDLEKVELASIEGTIFGPILLFSMMADPDVGEQVEEAIEELRELYKEIAVISGGIVFNPQTADVELSGALVPRKDSNWGKVLAEYKQQPTIFGGFRGTPANTVFSLGDSMSAPPLPNQEKALERSREQIDTVLAGVLEQIEMDDDTGEVTKAAKEVIDSLFKIVDAESKRGEQDYTLSFTIDGTLLFAFDTVSLAEIQKLAAAAVGFARQRVPAGAEAVLETNLAYTTVEGFSVSSFKLPIIAALETVFGPAPDDMPAALRALTLGGFWAVKEGDKQAIAVAAGIDFAKTQQAFGDALGQTRTPAPVQKPVGVFSMQGLGRFLQQTVQPIAEQAVAVEPDPFAESQVATFKKVVAVLAAAGDDATVTLLSDIKPSGAEVSYRISGKLIQAFISAVKVSIEASAPVMRPGLRDF